MKKRAKSFSGVAPDPYALTEREARELRRTEEEEEEKRFISAVLSLSPNSIKPRKNRGIGE